jgi:hypothetical protein
LMSMSMLGNRVCKENKRKRGNQYASLARLFRQAGKLAHSLE